MERLQQTGLGKQHIIGGLTRRDWVWVCVRKVMAVVPAWGGDGRVFRALEGLVKGAKCPSHETVTKWWAPPSSVPPPCGQPRSQPERTDMGGREGEEKEGTEQRERERERAASVVTGGRSHQRAHDGKETRQRKSKSWSASGTASSELTTGREVMSLYVRVCSYM